MLDGIKAKYETIGVVPDSVTDPLGAVTRAFNALRWSIKNRHADTIVAEVAGSGSSFGEEVTVVLQPDRSLLVKSKCSGMQVVDWGKNKVNVYTFLAELERVCGAVGVAEHADPQAPEPSAVSPTSFHSAVGTSANQRDQVVAEVGRKQMLVTWMAFLLVFALLAFKGWEWLQKSGVGAVSEAEQIVRQNMVNPDSYSRRDGKVVWSGKTRSGKPAFAVRLDYTGTNGFGGTIRDCTTVLYAKDGSKIVWNKFFAELPCEVGDMIANKDANAMEVVTAAFASL